MEERESLEREHLSYGNVTIASLLNAHIAAINSERQALWLRHTAMLLANSLLYGFFSQLPAPTMLQSSFATGFGWALCIAWLVSTVTGFRQYSLQLDAASAFARLKLEAINEYANPVNIDVSANPMIIGIQWRGPRRGVWLFRMMVFVITLFMLAYASLLTHHLYYRFFFLEGPR